MRERVSSSDNQEDNSSNTFRYVDDLDDRSNSTISNIRPGGKNEIDRRVSSYLNNDALRRYDEDDDKSDF